MIKKIILRLVLPLILFLLISYTAFWFIKSGEIKKNIVKALDSNTNITADNISSSGFPMRHNLEITTLTIRGTKSGFFGNDVVVENISTESNIFSNQFIVKVGNVSIQSLDKEIKNVKFNKDPIISLKIKDQKISEILYKDDGYSLLDDSGDSVFKLDSSELKINVRLEDDVQIVEIDSNFRDIDSFDVFDKFANIDEAGNQKNVASSKDDVISDKEGEDSLPSEQDIAYIDAKEISKQDIRENKSLPDSLPSLEIETVGSDKKENEADSKVVTNRNLLANFQITSEFDEKLQEMVVKEVAVVNLDLSSPMFNINVSGSLPSVGSGVSPGDLKIRVKNLDNILVYLKRWVSSIEESVGQVNNFAENKKPSIVLENNKSKNKSEVNLVKENLLENKIEDKNAEIDNMALEDKIAEFIVDLARKNPNTNDALSEFHIFGSELNVTINNVLILKVMGDISKMMMPLIKQFKEFSDSAVSEANISPAIDAALPQEIPFSAEEAKEEKGLPPTSVEIDQKNDQAYPVKTGNSDIIKSDKSISVDDSDDKSPAATHKHDESKKDSLQ